MSLRWVVRSMVPGTFAAEHGIMVALVGPQHLLDRRVEHLHAVGDGGIRIKRTDAVVQQERGRRPDTDQRGHPGIAAAAGGHFVGHRLAGEGIAQGHRADRGQILVGLR